MKDDWWDADPTDPDETRGPSRRRRRRRRVERRSDATEARDGPREEHRKRAPKKAPMPHFKRQCIRCHGTGRAPCQICGGSGQVLSGVDITGMPRFGSCAGCMGTKLSRCPSCGGEGIS